MASECHKLVMERLDRLDKPRDSEELLVLEYLRLTGRGMVDESVRDIEAFADTLETHANDYFNPTLLINDLLTHPDYTAKLKSDGAEKDYLVVLETKRSPYEGVLTIMPFGSKQDFKEWQGSPCADGSYPHDWYRFVAEGVTMDQAQKIAGTTPPEVHLNIALYNAMKAEPGTLAETLRSELKHALLTISLLKEHYEA